VRAISTNSISVITPNGVRQTITVPTHWQAFIVKHGDPGRQILFRFANPHNTLFVWDGVDNTFEYETVDAGNL
jgi:hypothetical protein